VIISAIQITEENLDEVKRFTNSVRENISYKATPYATILTGTAKGVEIAEMTIKTPEGIVTAHEGDWIIRGVEGEVYPCKDDGFRKTYEPVE